MALDVNCMVPRDTGTETLQNGKTGMITVLMYEPKYELNVGMLARTCDAVGAQLVVPTGTKCAGNTVNHELLYVRDPLNYVKHWPYRVYAIETGGESISKAFWTAEPLLLLLGNESRGLPDDVLEMCDDTYSLPQLGMAPCINVAVAGSVALYQSILGK